jgi:hypothetical protein
LVVAGAGWAGGAWVRDPSTSDGKYVLVGSHIDESAFCDLRWRRSAFVQIAGGVASAEAEYQRAASEQVGLAGQLSFAKLVGEGSEGFFEFLSAQQRIAGHTRSSSTARMRTPWRLKPSGVSRSVPKITDCPAPFHMIRFSINVSLQKD